MGKGMTATQTIVALAVGLIVLVGLGYLVWTWIGKGGGEVTESYCRSRAFAFCTEKSVRGQLDDNNLPDEFIDENPGCASYTWANNVNGGYCEDVLGVNEAT